MDKLKKAKKDLVRLKKARYAYRSTRSARFFKLAMKSDDGVVLAMLFLTALGFIIGYTWVPAP